MSKILVIDDDDLLRQSFCKLLREEGFTVSGAASGEAGIEMLSKNNLDLVILDMRLPGISGMETFQSIKKIAPKLPVIIVTAFGTTETAIEATKIGAFDYVLKPFEIPEMLTLIDQALETGHFMRSPVIMDPDPELETEDAIIGQSRLMQQVYKSIGRVAQTDATVLIRGESGTGKELTARAVYQHGKRCDKAFLVINCVAIPENLLESELFGYEKGAFTGAAHRHIGKIEQADKGTIFLDEIGDMPLAIQAKILRLLQERSIERLGSSQTIPVDVRIIAATNKNLETAIDQGEFREDLYFRLKVVTIDLPPLRNRIDDIDLLVAFYLRKYSKELDMDNPGILPQSLEVLKAYSWPGNIRELANLTHKALIFNRGAPLSKYDMEQLMDRKTSFPQRNTIQGIEPLKEWVRSELSENSNCNFENFIDIISHTVIAEALKITNGNRSQAAKLLDISRPTLHAKLNKYNIRLETHVSPSRE